MERCLSDRPVEELPCVRADMSLLLVMAGQFCPGYSSSIFSQATPYISISISSLWQALSANLLQTFSLTRESGDEELLGSRSVLLPVFPRCGNADSKRKICPESDAVVKIHTSWPKYIQCLAKDCLLREFPLLCLLIWRHSQLNLNLTKIKQLGYLLELGGLCFRRTSCPIFTGLAVRSPHTEVSLGKKINPKLLPMVGHQPVW